MAEFQEQYVTFDTTMGGEHSLRLFIERVPEAWHADFYELDHRGHFMTQYFRTKHPIDRFVVTPLVRDLPGAIDWGWNGEHIASYNEWFSRNQGIQSIEETSMQERDEAIAELQLLAQKAKNVHEEIEILLRTHPFSQCGELVRAQKAAHRLVCALLVGTDILKSAQVSQI